MLTQCGKGAGPAAENAVYGWAESLRDGLHRTAGGGRGLGQLPTRFPDGFAAGGGGPVDLGRPWPSLATKPRRCPRQRLSFRAIQIASVATSGQAGCQSARSHRGRDRSASRPAAGAPGEDLVVASSRRVVLRVSGRPAHGKYRWETQAQLLTEPPQISFRQPP